MPPRKTPAPAPEAPEKPVNRGNAGKGRPKGSLNKTTIASVEGVAEVMREMAYDPIAAMIAIAEDEETPLDVRIDLHEKLLKRRYAELLPKEESKGASGEGGITFVLGQ